MKATKRILSIFFIIITVTVAVIYFYTKFTLPNYKSNYKVLGINSKIKIYRDQFAIPHIYAQNQDDLAFGMGFVMAQDRLWQMDLFRRVATGKLSEIFGERTLEADRFAKIMGFQRNSVSAIQTFSSKEMSYLKAFVQGINNYIQSCANELPLEFTVLSYKPTPFTIEEIIALSNFQAYASNHNWKYEMMRSQAIDELGEKKGREFVPALTFNGPFMTKPNFHKANEGTPSNRNFSNISTFQKEIKRITDKAILQADSIINQLTGIQANEVHSNFWLVSGKRSESGKAILANDYHMPLLLPSLWYEVHLVSPEIDAIGITLPGYPTIVAGHNQHIAWGATTSGVDTQDLVFEKLNPNNSNEYLYNNIYYPFEIIEDSINYKSDNGLQTEKISIKISRNGPIINSLTRDLVSKGNPVSFRSIKNATEGQLTFCMNLYKAKNWMEFKEILSYVKTPIWNWGFADKNGNIGYKLNGEIPIRLEGYGLEPIPGWTDEYDWNGTIPFEELPEIYNPKIGFIVSANNEIVDEKYKYLLFGSNFQLPYRAIRIAELLEKKGKINQEDMKIIQSDIYSEYGLKLAQIILETNSDKQDEKIKLSKLSSYLQSWDGITHTESVATTIVQEFMVTLLKNTFANKVSKDLYGQFIKFGNLNYAASVLLLKLNDESQNKWFDNPNSEVIESKNQTIIKSLIEVYDSLTLELGEDLNDWKWGEIHRVEFKHQMGNIAPFKWFWNTTSKGYSGDLSTINPGTFTNIHNKPYHVNLGASMRHIIDFGNTDNSNLIITTGQSGRWLSPYYKDQENLWYNHKYIKVNTNKDILKNVVIGITVLEPLVE
ncbi:penicillin acylase family protein [Lutibacter sp.]